MISINYNNVCPLQAFLNWLILFIKGFMNIINNDYPEFVCFSHRGFRHTNFLGIQVDHRALMRVLNSATDENSHLQV